MHFTKRTGAILRGLLKRYAPENTKKLLWDQEFSSGHWNFIDNTAGDCVYKHLEKYADKGSILDLGCGPGNTANELSTDVYWTYVGVDISEAALAKARRRTEESGRTSRNRFAQGDFLSYVPNQQFDIILFREALYHVPLGKVKAMLSRYSEYLRDGGVFIVRMVTSNGNKAKHRLTSMVGTIETEFDVLEKCQYGESGPTVIVFRPMRSRQQD